MDADVLVVGAGPVGLATSLLLTRLGVTHRIIERRSGLHAAPQAHVISARTMEIFRAIGIEEARLRAIAAPMGDIGAVRWSSTLAGPDVGVFNLVDPGFVMKMLAAGPALPANISQNRLEGLLLEEVRAGGVMVEFDTQWESATPTPGGVRSTLRVAGQEHVTVETRFLLACDGAGSRVCKASGIAMLGDHAVQNYVNVHLKANLRDLVGDRPAVLYWIVDPATPGTFIAHDVESSWIFMHPLEPASGLEAQLDRDDARRLIERAMGAPHDFEIVSHDVWRMTAQVAERYRDGNTFLVGDAAHRFPPTGGMGLNTGIADAFNLTWKIAAVLRGEAGPGLLDTYEAERRATAETICSASLSNFLRLTEVLEAIGSPAGATEAEVRDHLHRVAADPVLRARVQGAVDAQAQHFDMTGLDIGQAYEEGALVPDGAPPPERADPVRDYVANARPGARLPHLWLQVDGKAVSVHDLVHRGSMTLIVGPDAEAWEQIGRRHQVPVQRIGRDLCPPEMLDAWLQACGIKPDGGLLVRPDQHVAWRGEASLETFGELLQRLLGTAG